MKIRKNDPPIATNIVFNSRAYPKKFPNRAHHVQRDLFPGQYWSHLNFIQRTLLIEQITQKTGMHYTYHADKWRDLDVDFKRCVIDYLESDDKPITFYYRAGTQS